LSAFFIPIFKNNQIFPRVEDHYTPALEGARLLEDAEAREDVYFRLVQDSYRLVVPEVILCPVHPSAHDATMPST
jgi:hypothetical protein